MSPSFPPVLRTALALVGVTLLAVALPAQQSAAKPVRDYSFSDTTGEMFAKFRVVAEAKNYDAATAILDAQLAKVAPDSYDAALIYQYKANMQLQKGVYAAAIQPLEQALNLSESKTPTYFDERATREFLFLLASLYLQEAVQSKNPGIASTYFEKADKAFIAWRKITPKSNADAQLVYSQLLYTWAVQNPDKPDLALLRRALEQIESGLHLSTHPKDTFYILKMVCLQQLNRNAEAVEILELMVRQKPESSTYWQQLAALYLSLDQNLRAILALERAQANGHLNTPKDNFNLVGIYYNIGQFEQAADLLEAGLKNGRIEKESKNWELLALCYQQLQRPFKSIEALKDATKAFPKSGQLEFTIAQAYYLLEKPEEALVHLEAAVAKGQLSKPHVVYGYMAYVAYELKKFDIALDAAKKAVATPEGAKDTQTQNLLKGIEDILKDREAKKKQM
jgi:tetratricopeptide (TPR) repeat protein